MSVYSVPQGSMQLVHALRRQEHERSKIERLVFTKGRVEVRLTPSWLRKQRVTK